MMLAVLLLVACGSDTRATLQNAGLFCGADEHPHLRWETDVPESTRVTYVTSANIADSWTGTFDKDYTCVEVFWNEHDCTDGNAFIGMNLITRTTVVDCVPGNSGMRWADTGVDDPSPASR